MRWEWSVITSSIYFTEYVERREKQVMAEQGKLSAGISNAKRVHLVATVSSLVEALLSATGSEMHPFLLPTDFCLDHGFIGWPAQWINLSAFLASHPYVVGCPYFDAGWAFDFPSFCRERRTGILFHGIFFRSSVMQASP